MIQALSLPVKMAKPQRMALGLYLVYAVIMLLSLRTYVLWQSVNVVLGLLALPLVTTIQPGNNKNIRYGSVAALFAILAVLLPVKTLLYFSIAFACFFVTENFLGKINLLPVGVVCLMSPVSQFTANVFSVPIRLQLTKWAGAIMNLAQGGITVKGNMIISNNNEFSVDPACMGLNMMVISLLLQLIIIAMYQRKHKLYVGGWQVAGLLTVSFVLNVVSNLFRIICLVWFNILPDAPLHELAGIFCLLLYVIIPMVWLTQLVIKHKGRPEVVTTDKTPVLWNSVFLIHVALYLIICLAAYRGVLIEKSMAEPAAAIETVDGYKAERVTTEIVKLENSRSLVYLKYIPGFFSADHHPMICWNGSGYIFTKVQLEVVGGQQVYTALLQNGKDQLYTGWWYDNGTERTVEQLSWRHKMLTGSRAFSVVNVTTGSKQQLINEIEGIIRSNRLKPLL
ncbi:exosortase N [Niastella populi]|uniref:Exosortase N n=1 Tax=Niastella populi TaxID=550983 RepID=A0A1V9FJU1_9BACT|nr:exosortase N [Niastella populi]OQP58628.1 exosortase N [Niastella populi]